MAVTRRKYDLVERLLILVGKEAEAKARWTKRTRPVQVIPSVIHSRWLGDRWGR